MTENANPTRNAEVTPLNELVLKDQVGVVLKPGQRVETTREGLRAIVTRLDKRSRRAVIVFEDPALNATMRAGHLLKVRKHAGRELVVKDLKAAVAAAKAAKAEFAAAQAGE